MRLVSFNTKFLCIFELGFPWQWHGEQKANLCPLRCGLGRNTLGCRKPLWYCICISVPLNAKHFLLSNGLPGLTEARSHTGLCNTNKEVASGNQISGPLRSRCSVLWAPWEIIGSVTIGDTRWWIAVITEPSLITLLLVPGSAPTGLWCPTLREGHTP